MTSSRLSRGGETPPTAPGPPVEVPGDIVERIRTLCLALPEVMVLGDDTDWEEIRELVTESYRILAPKKLTVLLY